MFCYIIKITLPNKSNCMPAKTSGVDVKVFRRGEGGGGGNTESIAAPINNTVVGVSILETKCVKGGWGVLWVSGPALLSQTSP